MSLAANAFQQALYDRLSAFVAGVAVYDHVPQGAAFPYIVIGQDDATPWDTKGRDGQEFVATVHVWGFAHAGRRSVKAIMEHVYDALHHGEDGLTLAGHRAALVRCEFSTSFQETGEAKAQPEHYYHGVMRFRALVEHLD